MHDVGVDAMNHCDLGYRGARLRAFTQNLLFQFGAVVPAPSDHLRCHRVQHLLTGQHRYRLPSRIQDGLAGRIRRKSEAAQKKKDPKKKARSWVVEACHGWFNRFRKLLVRYEKLEHTFLALNHLAAAIIALRKIELPVNIIYG